MILSQNSAQPAPFALFTPDVSVPSHGPQQPISSPQCAVCILDVTTGRFNVPARKCAACIPDAFAGPSTAFALTPFPAHPYKCPLPQTLLFDTLTNARGVEGCARSFALFCRSLHQECFTTPFQSDASALFLETAGVWGAAISRAPSGSECHPTIPILELAPCRIILWDLQCFEFSTLRLFDFSTLGLRDFRRSWNFPTGLLVLLYKHRPGAG